MVRQMFLGRKKEIEKLNALYHSKGFQFVVMYGRRRVGKTTLLSEFVKDKRHLFFVAEEYSKERALADFSQQIFKFFDLEGLLSFSSWNEAFDFFVKKAGAERIVLTIDEYPYLAGADRSISSFLQNYIDHTLHKTNIFLIICGSSMSFMEKDVLSYKSPLYGRKTAEMKVEPFDFYESCRFFPNYNAEEKVMAYSILGGVPQYLSYFDDHKGIRENVLRVILTKGSILYEEPKNILKQELREPMVYNTIIEAVAMGASRMNEISTKTRMNSDKCARYIGSLIDLGILEKEHPIGERTDRKSIYRIRDNLFKFWYRFVFHYISLTEQDESEFLYDAVIQPDWNLYIGKSIFENICRQYLWKRNKNRSLPFVFANIGRWWGNNPREKRQEEIDIVAVDRDKAIFCECKWRNEHIGMEAYNALVEKSRLLKEYSPARYFLFSKSGFTDELVQYAKNNNLVELVNLEGLFI